MKLDINAQPEFDNVAKRFKTVATILEKEFNEIFYKAALLIERESKQLTPVDTGRLRSSIFSRIGKFSATIMPTVNYAAFVHEGTKYMKGRPFMTMGVKKAKPEIEKLAGGAVKISIKKGLKK